VNLDGYVDVSTRLKLASLRFPDLRIVEDQPLIREIGDQLFIECKVTVWRSPEDAFPVVAYCWETWPGRSPFTRGSEQPNGSTSAVGRALRWIMPDLDGPVASADEVRNARESSPARPEREAVPSRGEPRYEADPEGAIPRPNTTSTDPATDKQLGMLRGMMRRRGLDDWTPPASFSKADASQLISELKAEESGGN